VTVSAGAQAAKGYNGDGHVVGYGSSNISRTLGTTEGSTVALNKAGATSNIACGPTGCSGTDLDTWIRNASGVPSFYFDFSNNFIIDSVSFDYQIFPDASCTALTNTACGGASVGGAAGLAGLTPLTTVAQRVRPPLNVLRIDVECGDEGDDEPDSQQPRGDAQVAPPVAAMGVGVWRVGHEVGVAQRFSPHPSQSARRFR
jgi:hypothetical protein